MDKNSKKSRKGRKKEIINLEQRVGILEEEEYLKENWYPLVFALSTEDYMDLPHYSKGFAPNVLLFHYQKVNFPNVDPSITYMGIDSAKLEEKFFSGACYLDQVKLENGKTMFVEKVDRNPENEEDFGLELVPKRKIILTSVNISRISFSDLLKVTIHNYEEKYRGRHVYSMREIREIHKRGNLTPFEKVREWKKIRYCPGVYETTGKHTYLSVKGTYETVEEHNRCKRFESCEECLRDEAYYKEEHERSSIIDGYRPYLSSWDGDDMVKRIGTR